MSIPDDVAKFLDGDVIIDRRNPFKEDDSTDNESVKAYCHAVFKNGRVEANSGDSRHYKNVTFTSPTHSLTSEATYNVALPVKHNITGNILNIDENKEFQRLVVKQSPEDQELIQKFLREKDSDAYASLIKILTMDNQAAKKKSLKRIIPSFFSKNTKHPGSKSEEPSNNSQTTLTEVFNYKNSDENGDNFQNEPIAKNIASDNNSSSSTLMSDKASHKGKIYSYGLEGDNDTLKSKNSSNELYIIENDFSNDSIKIAAPQESLKPKSNVERSPRSRSLSPHTIQNRFNGVDEGKQHYDNRFQPQYAYTKPSSPIPSTTHNVVITKPTIHHQASPDKNNVAKHVPQITMGNEELDYEVELRQKNNISFDGSSVVTSSPINNNQRSSNTYEHVGVRKEVDKITQEQRDRNLRNVDAYYWSELIKLKMRQDQELYRQYVMSMSDIHNGINNNFDKQRPVQEPWRCRSVSPNFNRNYTPVLNPIPKRMNTSMDSSLGNHSFQRNTSIRNTIGSTSNIQSQRRAYYDIRNNNNLAKEVPKAHGANTLGIPIIQVTHDNPIYGIVQKPAPLAATKPPIVKRGNLFQEATAEAPHKEKRVSFVQNYSQTPKLQSVHENLIVPNGNIRHYSPRHVVAQAQVDMARPGNKIYGKIVRQNDDNLYATVKPIAAPRTQCDNGQLYAKVSIKMKNSATNTEKNYKPQHLDVSNISSIMLMSVDSESGSEAGEVQRIMQNAPAHFKSNNDDWNPDGKNRGDGSSQGEGGRGRVTRRDDPRRHTLGGDLLRSAPPHSALVRGMDIEHSLPRGYPPPSSAMLFDDDPGIMSEVETASTGFRRGGKQRSSLPVVRTPSKTLERPLGLVFLQYRSETKRALLPNEITSIDTVKALFVRSFPKQLTMEYLDSPLVKIYIHDSSKDMFYELEDLRSHLRDIRDRSVLRLFESADVSGGTFPGSLGTGAGLPPLPSGPSSWDQDQSYFSEPEFDSDYHHQHIHKSKSNAKAPAYYIGGTGPSTLPRGGSLIRAYSPATGPPLPGDRIKPITGAAGAPPKPQRAYGNAASVVRSVSERGFPFTTIDGMRIPDQLYSLPADRIHNEGYMSSPERGSRGAYEEPYYTQYVGPTRGGMTPVIDEETGDPSMLDDQYSLYSVKIPSGPRAAMRPPPYDPTRLNAHTDDMQQRIRVEHMERQLANLTGLLQKALQAPVVTPAARGDFLPPSAHFRTASQGPVGVLKTSCSTTSLLESVDPFLRNERPPKLGKGRYHKSVSFEKSVSFSDEPPDMNSPKQHSPQHGADTKPPKPAIKSSTLPRMSSQERDRLKPVPPPKPKTLVGGPGLIMPPGQPMTIQSIEYQNYLKGLLKKCKELRMDMRNLRRLTLTQAHTMREMICDTFIKFRTATSGGGDFNFHEDSMRLARDEEIYKQEMLKLEADLCDLENTVEQLRGSVINRKARVNMVDVERMALVLSKSSKTVADLKVRFPSLHDGIKGMLGNEMEKVVREERFLKEEPERLEMALRRCKKLTGTLVTLKRLASVQEQRLPCDGGRVSPGSLDDVHSHDSTAHSKVRGMGESGGMAHSVGGGDTTQRSENALDALLDELQTFARPPDSGPDADMETEGEGEGERGLLRRLRGASSPEPSPAVIPRGQNVGKPPVPERNPELLQLAGRRAPPPPPPRTSSRSPLASPAAGHPQLSASNSSSCDSVDSQEGARARHDLLEQRHQELLRKQKALQEQYARLQQIQRGGNSLTVVPPQDLKKTGSESNLVTKLGLNMAPAAPMSGSLTHLARPQSQSSDQPPSDQSTSVPSTTSKVYETDIL